MISKKSLVAVLDKSIILTITSPNDNANQDPVQCVGAERSFFPVTVTKRILKTYICSPHEDDLLGHHHSTMAPHR